MGRQLFPGGRGRSTGPKVSISKNDLLNFNASAAELFKIKGEDEFAVYFDDTKNTIELERPGKDEQISGGITARMRKTGLSVYFSMAGALAHFGLECDETIPLPAEMSTDGKVIVLDVSALVEAQEPTPAPKGKKGD